MKRIRVFSALAALAVVVSALTPLGADRAAAVAYDELAGRVVVNGVPAPAGSVQVELIPVNSTRPAYSQKVDSEGRYSFPNLGVTGPYGVYFRSLVPSSGVVDRWWHYWLYPTLRTDSSDVYPGVDLGTIQMWTPQDRRFRVTMGYAGPLAPGAGQVTVTLGTRAAREGVPFVWGSPIPVGSDGMVVIPSVPPAYEYGYRVTYTGPGAYDQERTEWESGNALYPTDYVRHLWVGEQVVSSTTILLGSTPAGTGEVRITPTNGFTPTGAAVLTDDAGRATVVGSSQTNTHLIEYLGDGDFELSKKGPSQLPATVSLAPTYSLRGRVTFRDGSTPAPGTVLVTANRSNLWAEPVTALVGEDGAWRIRNLASNPFSIEFRDLANSSRPLWYYSGPGSPGSAEKADAQSVRASATSNGIDVTLGDAAAVEGWVTAADGTPVEAAWVTLHAYDPGQIGVSDAIRYWEVRSDADGIFRAMPLVPGLDYEVWVWAPGFHAQTFIIDALGVEEHVVIDAELEEVSELVVQVAGGTQRLLYQARLEVEVPGEGWQSLSTFDAEPGSAWQFTDMEAARYRVILIYPDGARTRSTLPLALAAGESRMLSVGLPGGFDHDFTGDGIGDPLFVSPRGVLTAFPGPDGSPREGAFWGEPQRVGAGFAGLRVVTPGDVDLDGDPDLYARDSAGRLWLYPGLPGGGWGTRVLKGTGWNGFARIITPGDFTGDGIPDLLAQASNGNVTLFAGNGTGSLVRRGIVARGWSAYRSVTAIGDFDGDGTADVAARNAAGTLWLLRGNGLGGWKSAVRLAGNWKSYTSIVGVGDATGDGLPDLVGINRFGWMELYYGNGSRGWVTSSYIGTMSYGPPAA